MSKIIPNEGLALFLTRLLNANMVLRLYTNNHVPSASDVASDYTEMSGLGYSSKTLTAGSWVLNGVEATYATQTFTFTAGTPISVYGYYVTNTSDGKVAFAENFTDGPFSASENLSINVTPRTGVVSGT